IPAVGTDAWCQAERQLLDATALDAEHVQAAAAHLDLVPDARQSAEPAEHEATDRGVVLIRKRQPEDVIQLGDRYAADEVGRTVRHGLEAGFRFIRLVGNLAHDLLEQILDRDDARRAAE